MSHLMSSFISWVSCMGTLNFVFNLNFYQLLFDKASMMEALSNSMGWLTGGVLVVSFIASEISKFFKKIWWSLSFILFISFFSLTLLKFYILFELSLIPILLMIISIGTQPERLSAGAYLIFYTTAISVPYLIILFFMKSEFSSFWSNSLMKGTTFVSIGILIPFIVKMPVFGVHFWLPKAHVEANTSGSMVLAGLLLKLGSYGAFRATMVVTLSEMVSWYNFIWITMAVLSSGVTCMQSDMKKLVAYSSVTHMTFLLVALVTSSKVMLLSTMLLSLSHGWTASGMFNMAGTLSQSLGSRVIFLMTSEWSLNWSLIAFGVMLVSNASVPPFPSFFPEMFMVSNIMNMNIMLIFLFIFLSLLVCYYNAFSFIMVSHVKPFSKLSGMMKFIASMNIMFLVFGSMVTLVWVSNF